MILIAVGSATFCVAFSSSLYVGGVAGMIGTFHKEQTVVLVGLSFYVGGFAFGPMLWAPLSELPTVGRRKVFLWTFAPFVLLQIGCALAKNIETLIICRMLAGGLGSSTLSNSAGVISDTFAAAERGPAMALYALMPFLGPVLAPVVGGFVGAQSLDSWRWLFGLSGLYGLFCLVGGYFVPETHRATLLRTRADRLSKQTGHVYKSKAEFVGGPASFSFRKSIARPFTLLFTEPIVFLFAVYASFIYGVLYLLFGAYPVLFVEDRGWSASISGLPFLAVGLGMLLGMALTVIDSAGYAKKCKASDGEPLAPEERLRTCRIGGILLPLSLAWYAASAKGSVHWIVPTLAGVPFGMGLLLVFLGGTSYLVDTYTSYAASAMAANGFMRSLFAAAFPLFTAPMFHKLGASWALALLAFAAIACAPIPFLFFNYGEFIRSKSHYAPTSRTVSTPAMGTASGSRIRMIRQESEVSTVYNAAFF